MLGWKKKIGKSEIRKLDAVSNESRCCARRWFVRMFDQYPFNKQGRPAITFR